MAHLATVTSTIRIGSGGVMLTHYSPYKVAENFKVLETLFSGRIDAEIGHCTAERGAYGCRHCCSARNQLERLAEKFQAEEIMLVTSTYDFHDKLKSYELIMKGEKKDEID